MVSFNRTLTFLLAACLLSLAFLTAGCGGDDGSSSGATADEWADDFCSALTTYTDDLTAIAEPLTDVSSLSEDNIQEAAGNAQDATETFAEDMRSLGTPDIPSGDQVDGAVESLATELESGALELEAAVADVSSDADVPAAVGTITTTLSELGREVGRALQTIEDADTSGELETAFENAESCEDLTG
jgi:hypothetical protein